MDAKFSCEHDEHFRNRVFLSLVRDFVTRWAKSFRSLPTFLNEVMPNLEFFSKNAHFVVHFSSSESYFQSCCRYLLRCRAFETLVQVALANRLFCGPAFFFPLFRYIIIKVLSKSSNINQIPMKNQAKWYPTLAIQYLWWLSF